MIKKLLFGLTVAAFAFAGGASAQGIKRTPLRKVGFPEGYTTVTAIAEVPAGGSSGLHSHPGVETGYVTEGEVNLVIDGQASLVLKAGDSCQIPTCAIHDAKAGDKPFKVLAIYIVDQTRPLTTPAS